MKYKYSIAQIEEKIKTETKDFIPSFVDKLNYDYVYVEEPKSKKISLFKLIFTLGLVLFAITGGNVVYASASEFESVTVDVNSSDESSSSPSIELILNRYNQVIDVNYDTSCAYTFDPLSLKHMPVSLALRMIAFDLVDDNYIDNDNDYNFVIISSYTKKNNKNSDLTSYINYFNAGVHDDSIIYYTFTNEVNDEIDQICEENDITYGQYKMMDLIMEDNKNSEEPDIYNWDHFFHYDYNMGYLGRWYYEDYYSNHGNHDFSHGQKWGNGPMF